MSKSRLLTEHDQYGLTLKLPIGGGYYTRTVWQYDEIRANVRDKTTATQVATWSVVYVFRWLLLLLFSAKGEMRLCPKCKIQIMRNITFNFIYIYMVHMFQCECACACCELASVCRCCRLGTLTLNHYWKHKNIFWKVFDSCLLSLKLLLLLAVTGCALLATDNIIYIHLSYNTQQQSGADKWTDEKSQSERKRAHNRRPHRILSLLLDQKTDWFWIVKGNWLQPQNTIYFSCLHT